MVTFSIHEKDGKVIRDTDNNICFAPLHRAYKSMVEGNYVLYTINSAINITSEEMVEWYVENLNKIGLKSSLEINNKSAILKVFWAGKENYPLVFCTLVALRYLEENSFPDMVKWAFKNKGFEFFDLFQLMHYTINNHNSGHSILPGFDIYSNNGGIVPFTTLEEFHNILKQKGKTYEGGWPGVDRSLIGKGVLKTDDLRKEKLRKTLQNDLEEAKRLLTAELG